MIYVGTTGNDEVTVSELDNYGLQGDDTFNVKSFVPKSLTPLLAGGSGNDHYIVESFSSTSILEAGNSAADYVTITMDFDTLTSKSVIVDNSHLVFYGAQSLFSPTSFIAILDFDTDASRIETFTVGGQQYSFQEFMSNLTQRGIEYINTANTTFRATLDFAAATSKRLEANALIDSIPDYDNAVYRFYNTETNRHFYTAGEGERDTVITDIDSFVYEGVAFGFDQTGSGDNVHRFYNTETGAHFYTISDTEKDQVIANYENYLYEGVAYQAHASQDAGTHALFRFYNHDTNTHFYTDSAEERDSVINTYDAFEFEGIAYYVDDVA